ncbi:hypothetical protein GF420_03820 [candidate division GN15 bacterium]|nr:hypothetical protein [candidate division GN15 bacterium]
MTIKRPSGKATCPVCRSSNVRTIRKSSKGARLMVCLDCDETFEAQKTKSRSKREHVGSGGGFETDGRYHHEDW